MTTDNSNVDESTLIDWACDKLNDDLELTIRDADVVKRHFDFLRKYLPVERRKSVPAPNKIKPYPYLLPPLSIDELPHLKKEFEDCKFSILIECTQVAALMTLWCIEDQFPMLSLNIEYKSHTGHDAVHETERRDDSTMPKFEILTCAPCYFLPNFTANYELMHPIHLEQQYVLQQGNGTRERAPRQIIFFHESTADLEWRWIVTGKQLPKHLLPFKSFRGIAVYKFEDLCSALNCMQRGDAVILWKPPSCWFAQLPGIQLIDEPFLSPIALYCRKKDVSDNVKREFIHLFFSVWEKNLRQWTKKPREAARYLKEQIRSSKSDRNPRRDFLIRFSRAAGIDTVQEPISLVTTSLNMTDPLIQLHKESLALLKILEGSNIRLTIEKLLTIEEKDRQLPCTEQTIRKRIKELNIHKFVHRPDGVKGGLAITIKGRAFLTKTT